jgi:acyl-CoA synthetase (AMP-forming)/AMP-acid ligase II/acyl carrier protein
MQLSPALRDLLPEATPEHALIEDHAGRPTLFAVPRGTPGRRRLEQHAGEIPLVLLRRLPRDAQGVVDVAALRALPRWDAERRAALEASWREAPGVDAIRVDDVSSVEHPRRVHPLALYAPTRAGPVASAGGAPTSVMPRGATTSARPAHAHGGPAIEGPEATLPALLAAHLGGTCTVTYVEAHSTRVEPFAALAARARRIAGGLRAAGLAPGAPVAILLDDVEALITTFWGAVLADGVPAILGVPPTFTERSSARELLVDADAALGRPTIVARPTTRGALLDAALLEAAADRVLAYDRLLEATPHAGAPTRGEDDDALLVLTSGSTGRPKVIPLTHRALLTRARGANQLGGFVASEPILSWLPFDHIGSISDWHVRPLELGASMVYAPKELVLGDPLRWLTLMAEHRATCSWAPNFAYDLVARAVGERGAPSLSLAHVRCLLSAGEPIAERTADAFTRALAPVGLPPDALRPAFGMAELGSGVTYARPEPGRAARFLAHEGARVADLGAPIPGCEVRAVDGDRRVVPEGVVGTIEIRGDMVTRGYRGASAEQQAAFKADGWMDTGDRGVIVDGHLALTGRAKDVIIVRGSNYPAHDLESAVAALPGVLPGHVAATAVSRPDERVAIFYAPSEDAGELGAQVRAIRREITARFGLVADFVVPLAADALPRTAIGKVQKAKLRARLEAGELDDRVAEVEALAEGPGTIPHALARPAWAPLALAPAPLARPVRVDGDAALADALAPYARDAAGEPRLVLVLAPPSGPDLAEPLAEAAARVVAALAAHDDVVIVTGSPPLAAVAARAAEAAQAERAGVRARVVEATFEASAARIAAAIATPHAPTHLRVDADRADTPRWIAAPLEAPAPTSPLSTAAGVVVLGGLGGLGVDLVERLLAERPRAILIVARTRVGRDATIAGLERAAALAGGHVDVARVDLEAPGAERALADAVEAWEQGRDVRAGALFQLAVAVDERRLERVEVDVLQRRMRAALAWRALAARRPDLPVVAWSSLAGVVGGAELALYGGVHAALAAALAEHPRGVALAFSAFRDVGQGQALARSGALGERGFVALPPEAGLVAAHAALARGWSALAVGLDLAHAAAAGLVADGPLELERPRVVWAGSAAHLDAPSLTDAAGRVLPYRVERRAALDSISSTRTPPSTPTEQAIAALFEALLGAGGDDRDADFFELGGHSLVATQLTARVREQLGIELPLGRVFELRTVARLAAFVDRDRGEAELLALAEQVRALPPELIAELLATESLEAAPDVHAGAGGRPGDGVASKLVLGVVTANRPEANARALQSFVDNARRHGHDIEVVVLDDSFLPGQQQKTRAAVVELSKRLGTPIRYAAAAEKRAFVGRVAEAAGVPVDVAQLAFKRPEAEGFAGGLNRNALVLHGSGDVVFGIDDDVLARTSPAPLAAPGVRAVRRADAADFWFFADREEALRSHPATDVDLFSEIARPLGQSPRALAAAVGGDVEGPLDAVRPDGRVRVTIPGLLGDCGWHIPFGHWGVTMGSLLLEGGSRERLVGTEALYRRIVERRDVLRVVDRLTIADSSFSMSTFWGLDTRSPLVPFSVAYRGDDLVFGTTLWAADDQASVAHLPFSLFHSPWEYRRYYPGEIFRSAGGYDSTRTMIATLRSLSPDAALTGAARYAALGRALVEESSRSDAAFVGALRDRAVADERAFLAEVHGSLARHAGLPAFWARDVEQYAQTLERSIERPDFWLPTDVVAAVGEGRVVGEVRRLIRSLGLLLEAWPALMAAAAALRRAGEPLAPPVDA